MELAQWLVRPAGPAAPSQSWSHGHAGECGLRTILLLVSFQQKQPLRVNLKLRAMILPSPKEAILCFL